MRFPVALAALLIACNPSPTGSSVPGEFKPTGEVLLKVNDKVEVTQDMVDSVVRLMPESELKKRKEMGGYSKMVEQIGLGEVLYRRALENGLHNDEGVQKAIQMKAREVLAQEYVHREMMARVTSEAIQQFYDERAVQYMKPQSRARHILVKEESLAKELLAKVQAGEDFAKLATEHTIDARTRGEGGDLGWFARDKLADDIASVAFDGELGKPTIIETRFGFHVIEPTARRPGIPLEEVREDIENQLRQREYEAVLDEVKAMLKYERFGEVLEVHNRTDPWGVTGGGAPPPHGGGGAPPPHGGGGAPPPHGGEAPHPHPH